MSRRIVLALLGPSLAFGVLAAPVVAVGPVQPTETAQARPVPDPPYGPCGPGMSYNVFDLRVNGVVTHCTKTVHAPAKASFLKKPPIWKFWEWRF